MDPSKLRALLAELQRQRQQAQIQQAQQQQQLEQAKAWNTQMLQQQQQRRQILQQAARGGMGHLKSPTNGWHLQEEQRQPQASQQHQQEKQGQPQQTEQHQTQQPLLAQEQGLPQQHQREQQQVQPGLGCSLPQHEQQHEALLNASIALPNPMGSGTNQTYQQGVEEIRWGQGVNAEGLQNAAQCLPQEQQQQVEMQPPAGTIPQNEQQQQRKLLPGNKGMSSSSFPEGVAAASELAPLPDTQVEMSIRAAVGQSCSDGSEDFEDGLAAPCSRKARIQPLALHDVLRAKGE
jgi:hypothetical protein